MRTAKFYHPRLHNTWSHSLLMALFFLNRRLLLGRKIRVTATFHSSSLPKIHKYCYMIVGGYSEQRDVWIAYFHYNNNKKERRGICSESQISGGRTHDAYFCVCSQGFAALPWWLTPPPPSLSPPPPHSPHPLPPPFSVYVWFSFSLPLVLPLASLSFFLACLSLSFSLVCLSLS